MVENEAEIKKQENPKDAKKYKAVGRRKEASARVTVIIPGAGNIKVNDRELKNYFPRETLQMIIEQPIKTCGLAGKMDVEANIIGSGVAAQAGALRHGISRALMLFNPDFRPRLKKGGFLTRDPRMKERKKYGQEGARRKFQWVKR